MIEKDRLIVLRTTRYGESDLVVHGINPRGAKLSLFAKGALRSKKRFAGGVLEPTHHVQIVYKTAAAQNSGAMSVLQEASLLDSFEEIRQNYDRLELALYFLQLVAKLAQEGVEDAPEIFDILGNSLRVLQTSESLRLLKLHFEVKILAMQGVLPKLEWSAQFLKLGIRDHAQVQLEPAALKSLQAQCRELMQEYLGFQTRSFKPFDLN